MLASRLPGVVWLQAPSGGGKSTFLRSFEAAQQRPVFWFAGSRDHRDLAAFVASFTQEVVRTWPDHPLPELSEEHQRDPLAFITLLFERIDQLVPAETLLVFDDAHLLSGEVRYLLHGALSIFGRRRSVVIASQELPDDIFAAELASSRMSLIGSRNLLFTEEEALALGSAFEIASEQSLIAREASAGWAAGTMLMLQLASAVGPGELAHSGSVQMARLILERIVGELPAGERRRMRLLARLSYIPTKIRLVDTGWASVHATLEKLSSKGLFVERDPARSSFILHALLRTALLAEANSGGDARIDGRWLEADGLAATGLVNALATMQYVVLAWELAAANGPACFGELIERIGVEAATSFDRALCVQIADHVDFALTGAMQLWRARALLTLDSVACLKACDAAYRQFGEDGDTAGQRTAIAYALLLDFALGHNSRNLEAWRDRLTRNPVFAGTSHHALSVVELAGLLQSQRLFGLRDLTAAQTSMVESLLLQRTLDGVWPDDECMIAATVLLAAGSERRSGDETQRLIRRIEAADIFTKCVAHVRATWTFESALLLMQGGGYDDASAKFETLLRIAAEHGAPQLRLRGLRGALRVALMKGDLLAAESRLAELAVATEQASTTDLAWTSHLHARVWMLRHDFVAAYEKLEAAEALMRSTGRQASATTIFDLDRVQVLHALGRVEEAHDLASSRACVGSTHENPFFVLTDALLRGIDARADRGASDEHIQQGIRRAAELPFVGFLGALPRVAGQVADIGLRNGWQTAFLIKAIRARNLPAPHDACAGWPWKLVVRQLGEFTVEVDAVDIVSRGKLPLRPLGLLRLLACQRTLRLSATAVLAALWPDSGADTAKNALDVTVLRLRKMLTDDSLILSSQGYLALDPSRTSSDVARVKELVFQIESANTRPNEKRASIDSKRLQALYQGDLHVDAKASYWEEAERDLIRREFVRGIRTTALVHSGRENHREAASLAESALSREPLAEGLYQLAMKSYLALDEPNEAMRVYRQCRQTLSITLGRAPSAETELLKTKLYSPT